MGYNTFLSMKGNTTRMRIGKRIRQERIKQGLTQEELAGTKRLHRTHLTRIENGKTNATIEILEYIARRLRIPVWVLIAPPKWNWEKYFEIKH